MRLRPQAESDALIRDFIETNHYVNPDGTPYEPDELPVVGDEHDDDDEDKDEAA
jgi:hypothetical protein